MLGSLENCLQDGPAYDIICDACYGRSANRACKHSVCKVFGC